MKHLLNFLIAISILSSCVICRLEEELIDYSTPHEMSEHFKSNYTFEEGSYWIYINQNLNQDSIVLSTNESGYTEMIPEKTHPQEFKKSTFNNITQGINFNHFYTYQIKYNGGGDHGELGQIIFFSTYIGDTLDGATVADYYMNLTVFSNTYTEVTKVSIKADEQTQHEFDYDTDLYFASNVGIIKKVIYDTILGTQTWELKRYHLE